MHRDWCQNAPADGQLSLSWLSLLAGHVLTLLLSHPQADGLCYWSGADRRALQSPGAAWVAGRSGVSGAWVVEQESLRERWVGVVWHCLGFPSLSVCVCVLVRTI